ncbi:hypothetical protein TMatcc_001563 [Talaromyces marneffei ATCC 18224]
MGGQSRVQPAVCTITAQMVVCIYVYGLIAQLADQRGKIVWKFRPDEINDHDRVTIDMSENGIWRFASVA